MNYEENDQQFSIVPAAVGFNLLEPIYCQLEIDGDVQVEIIGVSRTLIIAWRIETEWSDITPITIQGDPLLAYDPAWFVEQPDGRMVCNYGLAEGDSYGSEAELLADWREREEKKRVEALEDNLSQ